MNVRMHASLTKFIYELQNLYLDGGFSLYCGVKNL